jgi:ribonuclease P protein component
VNLPRPRGRFAASARVRKRKEFRAVQSQSRRIVTPSFVFLVHARPDALNQPPRLGITASKKLGNAPTRNRAKRLVREAFRAVRQHWARGIDVVVIVRRLADGGGLWNVLGEWTGAQRALLAQMHAARRRELA